jgi:ubiquinone/menaquinone biosynthesis C-methylase UbiE
MTLLLVRERAAFEEYTQPLREPARQCTQDFQEGLETKSWGRLEPAKQAVARYLEYLRWPTRRMEYSFVMRALERHAKRQVISRVLDVGSGPSPFPAILSAAFRCPVWCVDRDPEVVEAIRVLAPPGCTYEVSDMSSLPFGERSFDVVTCVSVLEHVARSEGIKAIAEMLRVVKENGVVIITVDYCSLATGWRLVKWLSRGVAAAKRLATGRVKTLVVEAGAPRAYNWIQLRALYDRYGEQMVDGLDEGMARLSLRGIRSFWREHWEPGFSYDRRRGRDYTSVGLLIAPDPQVRAALRSL